MTTPRAPSSEEGPHTSAEKGRLPRRTQAQRSAETRLSLIQATLEALDEMGYARVTTSEIARRAGVTRGALMHHYATKEELVATAVEKLLDDSTQEIRGFLDKVASGELTLDAFLDHLWQMYSGRLLFITIEHITESRHNEPLREGLIPVVRRFHGALDAIWREFFRGTTMTEGEVEVVLNATTCIFRGMGIQTVLRQDREYFEHLLSHWKSHVRDLVSLTTDRKGLTK